MDAFWRWLIRTNAKVVCLCAVAALLVTSAWWTWKELSPGEREGIVNMPPGETRRKNLGITNLLAAAALSAPESIPQSPFRPPVKPRPHRPPRVEHVNKRDKGKDDNDPVVQPRPPKNNSSSRPQAKGPETVSLTYRGQYRTTDGRTMALIEDSSSKMSRYYGAGSEVCGMRIAVIGPETIEITLTDGTFFSLQLGKSEVFEGGRHER
ncbi:MAG: hypothetical protein R6V03_05285 [Kiritimatiellia bacterium]